MRRRWRQPPKQSLSCELRVAISLVRLQGEPALAGVAEVYGKFSEGFDTADTGPPPGDTGVVLILCKERWETKASCWADPMEGQAQRHHRPVQSRNTAIARRVSGV